MYFVLGSDSVVCEAKVSRIEKPVSLITENDLLQLIADKESEGKTLDYKRDLVGRSDTDKREFLHDVSSFANTLGGHLIFGMDEKDGEPINIPLQTRQVHEMFWI
jgi:predicted HTH transcriptional regulator